MDKNIPQFKVGDKVKILPKTGFPSDYFPTYVDGMLQYAGRLATITDVTQQSCKIDLDKSIYFWPFRALQLVNLETDKTVDPSELKNGDYIKVTNLLDKWSCIYIVKEIKYDKIYRHIAYFPKDKSIDTDSSKFWGIGDDTEIIYATEEEKKLLDNALLEQGYKWNNLTKQLDSIGLVNIDLADTYLTGISTQPVDVSSFRNSIQRTNNVTNLSKCTKEEPQTETELNLFPTKKHYQLNFDTY